MTQNDLYLIKLKSCGVHDSTIAKKLGIPMEEVESRWKEIQQQIAERNVNGYGDLCDRFTMLCAQYEMLGDSLKEIGTILGNVMPEEELRELMGKGLEARDTINSLRQHAIVLRPYVPSPMKENNTTSVEIHRDNSCQN